ncbi:MAG: prephenate dehydratase domain-containing protein [Methanolinea sp.]|nr:prephenate dehydratase domain-containing protein [Methanolinea sp.]
MKVFALGPEGTFSHELGARLFGDTVILLPTIRKIFETVERGEGIGLVPLENSEAGGVGPSMDGLLTCSVYITGEAYVPVHHHLVSLGPLGDAGVLYVHPQTHEQCSDIIEELGLPVVHTSSNAQSARELFREGKGAAIVPGITARFYGLPVRKTCVENSGQNVTRFVTISRTPYSGGNPAKGSIIVDPREDRAGLLHDILGVFARRGINLTRIESRPSKRGMGSYVFFIDYDDAGEESIHALRELEAMTRVKDLGRYPVLEAGEWT